MKSKLAKAPLGWRIEAVERYILERQQYQEDRLARLDQRLDEETRQNESLRLELSSLTAEVQNAASIPVFDEQIKGHNPLEWVRSACEAYVHRVVLETAQERQRKMDEIGTIEQRTHAVRTELIGMLHTSKDVLSGKKLGVIRPKNFDRVVTALPNEEIGVNEGIVQGDEKLTYLAGKLVGADIHGENGEYIATIGEEITPELVHRVEAEGKMAELILEMTIPGFNDENDVSISG